MAITNTDLCDEHSDHLQVAEPILRDFGGVGERNAPVRFANVGFFPGHYLYADEDGVIISETAALVGATVV